MNEIAWVETTDEVCWTGRGGGHHEIDWSDPSSDEVCWTGRGGGRH